MYHADTDVAVLKFDQSWASKFKIRRPYSKMSCLAMRQVFCLTRFGLFAVDSVRESQNVVQDYSR